MRMSARHLLLIVARTPQNERSATYFGLGTLATQLRLRQLARGLENLGHLQVVDVDLFRGQPLPQILPFV